MTALILAVTLFGSGGIESVFERPIVEPTAPTAQAELRPTPRPTAGPRPVTKLAAQRYALSRVGEKQYACLYKLWKRESGWRWNAENRSSGAYGIPQALPGSKMKSAGADWKTNGITQVKWGLRYIEARYGSPCGAWSHFVDHHWY